jgi:Flp pilus assembly protein TadD
MVWDGKLEFRVEDDPACPFDYSRDPDALAAKTDYVLNLCGQGAAELALSETEGLLARSPNDPMGLTLMGIVQWQLGKKEEGVELLRRAALLAPDNAVIVGNYKMFSGQSAQSSTQEFGWLPEL